MYWSDLLADNGGGSFVSLEPPHKKHKTSLLKIQAAAMATKAYLAICIFPTFHIGFYYHLMNQGKNEVSNGKFGSIPT